MATMITKKELLLNKIAVISLGCDKNRVDTENVLGKLTNYGFEIIPDIENAEIILVNTCAFLKSAREEGKFEIEDAISYKTNGKCKKVFVLGCMAQKFQNELHKIDGIDNVIKISNYPNIVNIIRESFGLKSDERLVDNTNSRVLSTLSHYAYLKIADGCNNFCSYCLIPAIRGAYVSRPFENIIMEAKNLVKSGVRELIIVAQDTTRYGLDLYKKQRIVELIQELSKIEDLRWIRLHYLYPEMVTDELINEIATNKKVCKYMDIPLQHINNKILADMKRRSTSESTKELINKIRTICPEIALRTSLIVGFPGETETEFNELYNFIKEFKLNYVGAFAFSCEEGTLAYSMENQVPEKTKNKRKNKLMKLTGKIIKENNKQFLNTILEVVIEDYDEKLKCYIGRNQYNSAGVDTVCYVKSNLPLRCGMFVNVLIKKVKNYDLLGDYINEN